MTHKYGTISLPILVTARGSIQPWVHHPQLVNENQDQPFSSTAHDHLVAWRLRYFQRKSKRITKFAEMYSRQFPGYRITQHGPYQSTKGINLRRDISMNVRARYFCTNCGIGENVSASVSITLLYNIGVYTLPPQSTEYGFVLERCFLSK